MKVALICPSNLLYMPYVENYTAILDEEAIDYDIINWDRFHIEDENNTLTYCDKKTGHPRTVYDYYKYNRFVKTQLKNNHYEKIIVFGLQLTFFLQKYLLGKYKKNY